VVVADTPIVVAGAVVIVVGCVVVVVTVGAVVAADAVVPASPPLDPEQAVTSAREIIPIMGRCATTSTEAVEDIDDGPLLADSAGMLAHASLLPDDRNRKVAKRRQAMD
jgi:hypothetical protein